MYLCQQIKVGNWGKLDSMEMVGNGLGEGEFNSKGKMGR